MNLAIWFALHVLFHETVRWQGYGMTLDIPVWRSIEGPAAVLTFAAVLATFRFKTGMLPTLLACSLAGALWHMSGVH
jgi:chromate transporter